MLKYYNFQIALQEIPQEITLAINITGCPNHCDGCHSPWLWEDTGEPLTEESLEAIMKSQEGYTCICFMGGDADPATINQLAKYIKENHSDIKVAWYSGKKNLSKEVNYENFDYAKIGHYDKERGALDALWTNQRLLKIKYGTLFEDITNLFRK